MAKSNVLVTGGAGFIGSALVELLLRKEKKVTVLDNFSFGTRKNIPVGVRVICGDLRSRSALRRAFDRPYETVFHLAAIHFIPYCNAHPSETISVNVNGTHALLEALSRKKPKRLFFASTAAVYDTSSRYHQEREELKPMDIYGASKLAAEILVQQFCAEHRVPVAIGRLFNAYGPRETNPHLIPEILNQLKSGSRIVKLGNLHPYRDYIHTSDVAQAISLLARKASKHGVTANIASGNEYSVQQVAQVISKLLRDTIRIQSRQSRKRKVERLHLRGNLKQLKRITGFQAKIRFASGMRDLLKIEGILKL